MICYHFASPFSHGSQLADILAVQALYYVVTEQLQLLAVTDRGKNSSFSSLCLLSFHHILCLQRMGETAPVSIPKIKYTGFPSKTLVSN